MISPTYLSLQRIINHFLKLRSQIAAGEQLCQSFLIQKQPSLISEQSIGSLNVGIKHLVHPRKKGLINPSDSTIRIQTKQTRPPPVSTEVGLFWSNSFHPGKFAFAHLDNHSVVDGDPGILI